MQKHFKKLTVLSGSTASVFPFFLFKKFDLETILTMSLNVDELKKSLHSLERALCEVPFLEKLQDQLGVSVLYLVTGVLVTLGILLYVFCGFNSIALSNCNKCANDNILFFLLGLRVPDKIAKGRKKGRSESKRNKHTIKNNEEKPSLSHINDNNNMSNNISQLVAYLYPAWASLKTIRHYSRKDDKKDDSKLWLTYWVIFGFFAGASLKSKFLKKSPLYMIDN
ncbi:receptor accessory protein-like protein [Reticulomyxa filosa]|uniref:Receptor accessory protein-like protein n=1 Tax=Reticulomyxa filosa TaxID=46433 RepID=X6NMV4_RETFI|nr:receptor accessory protein-like protein [Reticulomyxa filosa]|eukprot:ETO27595.1 receptor accessory protein-like protein [Reticulomyxa filosa]